MVNAIAKECVVADKKPSEKSLQRVEELKKLYPDQRSAVMPVLYIAQEEFGLINEAAIQWVSKVMDMPPVQVMEVATFYTMYYKRPVGKYHFQVCRTLSCALRGAKQITEHLCHRFKVKPNEVTADGKWSYEDVECLGSCGTAPMCEINDLYFENLTVEKLDEIITRLDKENPDLRYSTINDSIGDGLKGYPKSQILPDGSSR